MTHDTPPLAQPPSPAAQAIEPAGARSASLPKASPQAPRPQLGQGLRRLVLRVGGVRAIHQKAEGRQWAASQLSLKALQGYPSARQVQATSALALSPSKRWEPLGKPSTRRGRVRPKQGRRKRSKG